MVNKYQKKIDIFVAEINTNEENNQNIAGNGYVLMHSIYDFGWYGHWEKEQK